LAIFTIFPTCGCIPIPVSQNSPEKKSRDLISASQIDQCIL
jgi:hypothetical protein